MNDSTRERMIEQILSCRVRDEILDPPGGWNVKDLREKLYVADEILEALFSRACRPFEKWRAPVEPFSFSTEWEYSDAI